MRERHYDPLMTAGRLNSLTDVPGIRVGNLTLIGDGALSGTTVIVPPPGSVAGVDVRGGAPSTRETAALDPRHGALPPSAFVLTGGSSYGLSAAHGVFGALGGLVPAAALFDLGRGGDFHARPGVDAGVEALRRADGRAVEPGNVGAGTGAVTAQMKGGLGSASTVLPDGTTVAVLVAMNAVGSTIGPDGLPFAAALGETSRVLDDGIADWQEFRLSTPDAETVRAARVSLEETVRARATRKPMNTVIGIIATDAVLTPIECHQLARRAQDGLAQAIQPSHCLGDGDTLFAVATGKTTTDVDRLLEAAGAVTARAIVHAVLAADSVDTGWGHIASYRELYPQVAASYKMDRFVDFLTLLQRQTELPAGQPFGKPDMREGQAYANALAMAWPHLLPEMDATVDPFGNDRKLPAFLDWLDNRLSH